MNVQLFGRHLHNQIVVPLLIVSLCVAVVATFVGVYRLNAIIDTWVAGNAYQATVAVDTEFDDIAELMARSARLAADDPELSRALGSADTSAAARRLDSIAPNIGADTVMALDESFAVFSESGRSLSTVGAAPLGGRPVWAKPSTGFASFFRIEGRDVIAGVYCFKRGGRLWTLVASRVIDDTFMCTNFRGGATAFLYSSASDRIRARFLDRTDPDGSGAQMQDSDYVELHTALSADNPAVREAITHPGRVTQFSSRGEPYAIRTERIAFPHGGADTAGPPVDPTGAERFVTVVVSNRVASDAGRTTIALIAFWSLLAVVVLTGLGTIVARNVSGPLNALSDSARRVADGDFGHKVEIVGTNEVAVLAESFNAMTDSLRERTDTLTKKVLELATLYEMSRALGSTLDLEVLLDSVLDSAMRIFDVDSGYVMLRDKHSQQLDLRSWRGAAGRPDEGAIRSSMSDWVVRQGRPLIFNPPADDSVEHHVDSVTGALAALCVPLVSGEGVIGAIAVGSKDPDFRFSSDDVRLLSTIANHVTIAIGNIELFSSLQDAYLATVRSLAEAVDAKDPYTRGHSDRVAAYARAIAERLGLGHEQCTALEMAAYLHDIGKIGIQEEILLKPGKLDSEEMGIMRHHPLIGANILKPVAFPWPITPVVRHHHEHFDGKGYPAGLRGEEIPLLARILTVADAYEAMTADRPYRRGRTSAEAVAELRACAGTHFDPRVVEGFEGALAEMDPDTIGAGALPIEEVAPEEARAIFVAVVDGMFSAYRRLGGPRLASNLESELSEWFETESMPLRVRNGRISAEWDDAGDEAEQLMTMRRVVDRMVHSMSGATGRGLVEHFYDDAVSALSERMRHLAGVLDLYPGE